MVWGLKGREISSTGWEKHAPKISRQGTDVLRRELTPSKWREDRRETTNA
jgi:hypothetical protein